MANHEQVKRLKHSVKEWNTWREEHPEIQPDISNTNLNDVNLDDVNLNGADLSHVTLFNANLSHADLSHAHLFNANLFNADLSHAYLINTNLSHAHLIRTNFNQATFVYTVFAWVDLSNVKGLETAKHSGPSTVNINTVILPRDEQTRLHFLRGVGFSDTAIEYLP